MQEWLRGVLYARGYVEVITPHIYKTDVWKISGHYDFYGENMYFFEIDEGDGRVNEYAVKPMNCPGHVLIFDNDVRSYRDLPMRISEFGTVYRHELSGVVHGLMRARGFTQDDAHIFCTAEQVHDEVIGMLDLVDYVMGVFGFEYTAEVSTRPEKSIGEDEDWELATDALIETLEERGIPFEINEGDGAFYGPKIDIKLKDAIGRTWQCSTIQVDFNFPARFDLTYRTAENTEAQPFMLHRTILGSMERFFGILIEHYAGAFPTWLAPVQAVIIPIADRHLEHAETRRASGCEAAGVRVEVYAEQRADARQDRQGAGSRRCRTCSWSATRRSRRDTVGVRERTAGDIGAMGVAEFAEQVLAEKPVGAVRRLVAVGCASDSPTLGGYTPCANRIPLTSGTPPDAGATGPHLAAPSRAAVWSMRTSDGPRVRRDALVACVSRRLPCRGSFVFVRRQGPRAGAGHTEVSCLSAAARNPGSTTASARRECRLIGIDGSQLGIFAMTDAQRIADEQDLDLVEIAPHRRPAGLPDHGLRQVQVRAGAEGEAGAQAPDQGRDQRDQVPAQDRQARLRDQEEARRALPGCGRQGQGHDHVPRSRDGAPGARAEHPRAAGRRARRARDHRDRSPSSRAATCTCSSPRSRRRKPKESAAEDDAEAEAAEDQPAAEPPRSRRTAHMPKMKTHKGTAKRFRVTGTGKIMRGKAFKSHILEKKRPKRKRGFRQETDGRTVRHQGHQEEPRHRLAVRRDRYPLDDPRSDRPCLA